MRHVLIINPTAGRRSSTAGLLGQAEDLRRRHGLAVGCILTRGPGHAEERYAYRAAVKRDGLLAGHLPAHHDHGEEYDGADNADDYALRERAPLGDKRHTHAKGEDNAADSAHNKRDEIFFLHNYHSLH